MTNSSNNANESPNTAPDAPQYCYTRRYVISHSELERAKTSPGMLEYVRQERVMYGYTQNIIKLLREHQAPYSFHTEIIEELDGQGGILGTVRIVMERVKDMKAFI